MTFNFLFIVNLIRINFKNAGRSNDGPAKLFSLSLISLGQEIVLVLNIMFGLS